MKDMAKEHVEFETPKELVNRAYEAITTAKATGKVSKGVNETTKSIERGLARLVVIAEDIEPPEIVMHLPVLCKEKQIPFLYVPSKLELGRASGISVPTAAVSIVEEGDAKRILDEISEKVKELNKYRQLPQKLNKG
jgi:large subunit ribosomal protein L7Ae